MAVNKVVFGDQTIMDISDSTVNANNLLSGVKAYGANGVAVTGAVVTAEVVDNLITQDANKALSAKQGYVLDQKKIDKTASEIITNTTGQFNTVTGGKLESCIVGIAPKQNLHGYDKPWVGGAGKNKFPSSEASTQTSGNISVTSDGHGTYTFSGSNTSNTSITFELKDEYTIPTSIGGGGQGCFYLNNSKANSSMSMNLYYDNTLLNPVTVYPVNRKLDAYAALIGLTFNKIVFTIPANFDTTDLVMSPMITNNGSTTETFEWWDNVCPITGHSSVEVGNVGENRLHLTLADLKSRNTSGTWSGNVYTDNNVTFTCQTDSDGNLIGVDVNGTAPTGTDIYLMLNSISNINSVLTSGSSYKLCAMPSNVSNICYVSLGQTGNDTGSGLTFTAPASGNNCAFKLNAGKTANHIVIKPMITTDTTATYADYVPYNPSSKQYTVALGQTVYGGSLDVVSGVLTVDKVGVDMGSLSWTLYQANIFTADVTGREFGNFNILCSMYPVSASTTIGGMQDKEIKGSSDNNKVIIKDSSYSSDASALTTAVTGQQLVYELATPITIQLTPQQIETLIGQNNISVPLAGQSLDSITYREVFAWDDVDDTFANKEYNKDYLKGHNQNDEIYELGAINPTTGENQDQSDWIRNVNFIKVQPSTSYYIKVKGTRNYGVRFYGQNKNYIGLVSLSNQSKVMTTPNNCYYVRFTIAGGTAYNEDLSLNYPSSFTSYEPYIPSNVELANGSARDNAKLPLSGGTMTGQLKTSFRGVTVGGSYGSTANNIPDFINEVRFSSGCSGSVYTLAYTKDGTTIPAGWYNFLWIPHRSGGANGNPVGDNCNYGACILSIMASNSSMFLIRVTDAEIKEVNCIAFTSYVNSLVSAKTGKWLESTQTLSTSSNTTYTFTDSDITASSMVDAWCEIDGFDYSSMTVAAGSVTVVYPKYTSAVSMKCRINVKNITI